MKSILILLLFAFSAYVACEGQCTPDSNPNHAYQSWMSPFGDRAFKDILLLASHDAGTYPYDSKSKNTEWFVTQSQNIGLQLCGSYRMFDMRVKSVKGVLSSSYARDCSPDDQDAAGTVNKYGAWRVYHEDSHFDCVHRIAAQIKTFCDSHPTEVAIFRLKMESADADTKDKFYEALASKIGNCVVRRDLLSTVAPNTNLQDATLNQVLNATVGRSLTPKVATGGVIFLDYSKKDKLTEESHQAVNLVFNYPDFQMGEFSNSLDFDEIQTLQHEKYTEWAQLAAPQSPRTKPTFGWWTTFTSVSSNVKKSIKNLVNPKTSMNVEQNTGEIFTGGSHANWVSNWVNERVTNRETVKGVTLWTDFAGDPRQTEIVRLAAKINCNLSKNVTANTELGAAGSAYAACTNTKNRFSRAKKLRHSHKLKMSAKKCHNKKCHHHKH